MLNKHYGFFLNTKNLKFLNNFKGVNHLSF